MKTKIFLILGFVFAIPFFCFSQKDLNISLDSIPKHFIKDSNILIIDKNVEVEILNQTTSREKLSETALILNKRGLANFNNGTSYDKLTKIDDISIFIYDAQGKFLKKINANDFSDVTLIDGFSIYNDNRSKYANIDYTKFPFFAKIEYTKTNDFTIFIPPFYALEGENHKVLNTRYSIKFPENVVVNTFEVKLGEYNIDKQVEPNQITYFGKNLVAPDYEEMNLRYLDLLPEVKFSLDTFSLAKINGRANSWNDFGIWYHKNFLEGLDVLPNTTVAKMKDLTKDAKSELEKVEIIFDYVQKNTRYVSIQTGIGGWKPFSAKEVDKLKYGDCKALTNYTKALLNAVGVTTYYTILYASDKIRDINEEIIGMQGNHAILTYPHNNGYIFLECTSQSMPFGYLSSKIDNRKVLLITDNEAKLVTTKSYKQDENRIEAHLVIDMTNFENVKTTADIVYSGLFYSDVYDLNIENTEQVSKFIQNQFSNFKGLKILTKEFVNNKEEILFKEKVSLQSSFIGSKAGEEFLVRVNPFLNLVSLPKKYPNRTSAFQISRNKNISVSTIYIFPEDLKISFLPKSEKINSKFGDYEIDYLLANNTLVVNERYKINASSYSSEEYEAYREFVSQVQKNNMSKFILKK